MQGLVKRWGRVALLMLGVLPVSGQVACADVTLPNIFGDHMVLQRDQKNRVWGKADAGEEVTVKFDSQTHATKAGDDGKWMVTLEPLSVGPARTLTVQGKNKIEFTDVLVGEVWVCAGQSNMQWSVNSSNDQDLEKLAANFPNIRLISVPQVGTQEPQWNFNGKWTTCTPETVGGFSAVGYFFGRQLHQTLGVPVGLINNAWGGSAAEAWVRRDILAADEKYSPLLARWSEQEAGFEKNLAAWKVGQHLQRCAQADDWVRNPRSDLVPGRIERQSRLSVSRPLPADDQELAGRVGPGRLPVLLGPTGRLQSRSEGPDRKRLG